MVEADKSFTQHAGYVLFPRNPADLTSTTRCPACFTLLESTTCSNCGLDLAHPAAAELAISSTDAAAALERRLQLIGRIRFETAASASAATAALAHATVAAPTPAATMPTSTPPTSPPPAPPVDAAAPVQDAAPRRHFGVQVVLLIVGVSLLAVGAIFFLVYAFITFGLVWRSVIIGTVTVAAFVGASLLKRRNLGATAEAIAALAVVFVYLDAFALRANDLFGLGDSDALVYWGTTLILSAIGFAAWHRLSGLRMPNIVAFAAFAPGVALLVAGLAEPLEDATRVFGAFVGLAAGGLVHPLARRTTSSAARPERVIALLLALLGLVGAAVAALVISPESDWAPALGLGVVALVALAHTIVAVRSSAPRALAISIAAFGAAAAAAAVLVVALRVAEGEFIALWPPIAAVAVTLALEFVARRAPAAAKPAATGATLAAAGVAVLVLLIPLGTGLGIATSIAARGAYRWGVGGGETFPPSPEQAAGILALVVVVALIAIAWGLSRTIAPRRAILLSAALVVLVLAVPLLGVLWAIVSVWLLLGALGAAALIVGRGRGWSAAIRMPVAVVGAAALALAYASSWQSIDTWWYGSVGTVAILVATRLAVASPAVRAVLLGIAAVLALVAIGSEAWHTNERFMGGAGALADATHAVTLLAVMLLALSALLAGRSLSAIETRVLFWISLAATAGSVATSWRLGAIADAEDLSSLVLPEFTTSLVLGVALFAALSLWVLLRRTAAFRPERIVASVAVAPAVSWLVDSFTRALGMPEFVNSIAPITAALLVSAGALAITLLRPSGTPRWTRELGVGLVAAPALSSAVINPSDATWLVLVLAGVTALLLAISRDGLFASASPRRLLGWAALALGWVGLWWRLGEDRVRDLEPYVLPLAGALLLIALLVWKSGRRAAPPTESRAAPFIALAGLLVAILPLGSEATSGPELRTMVVAGASAALLLVGSFAPGNERLRPYLDVAALSGAVGVITAGIGRPLVMAIERVRDDASLDAWLAASFLVLLVAAVGQARVRHEPTLRMRGIASQVLGGLAMVCVFAIEASILEPGLLGTARAMVVLLVFCGLHVVGILVGRAPFTRVIGGISIVLAAVTGAVAVGVDVVDPLEWASVPVAAALLLAGAIELRRTPAAHSWGWIAPGIVVLLVPTLIATFTEPFVWRLVALGAASIATIIVGALGRLQAPLILGSVIVLVHALRTFAPQLVLVYQSTEWWVWAVVGGAIILFLGFTFEKRIRDLKNVTSRIAALR